MSYVTLPERLFRRGVRAGECERIVTNRRGTGWVLKCSGGVAASGGLWDCLAVLRALRDLEWWDETGRAK